MKIRTRILIYYTGAFIAIIILIGYFMLNSITNYIIKNTVNNLIDNIYINREINLIGNNPFDPEEILRKYADSIVLNLSENNIFIKLYDKQNLISYSLYDSVNLYNDEKANMDDITKKAIKGNNVYAVKKDRIYLASPIKFGNDIIGAVEYIYPLKDELKNISFIKRTFEISGLVSIIIVFILSLYISNVITKPLKLLDDAAKKFSQGRFEKVPITTRDEVGSLTETFNCMAKAISKHIIDIAIEKNKLNSVLSGLNEGVIAFNDSHIIIFKNKKIDEFIGENIPDFIFDVVNETYKNKHIIKELRYNDKILNVESFLSDNSCTIVIRDVTLDRELIENQRKFVSNVSHELKTPVTTIAGFIQILKDEGKYNDDILNYLENEANRLKKLVIELLELSRLQSYELKLQKKTVNLSELLSKICDNIAIKALKFDISINTKIQDGINAIVDGVKISQVIINILDNAIKYSKPGQPINVMLYKNYNSNIIIEITDYGIGIPENEISLIFDRFYRAQNALSVGGNGLGLTIVKEIIEKHGGKVEVESTVNHGSTFRIILP